MRMRGRMGAEVRVTLGPEIKYDGEYYSGEV